MKNNIVAPFVKGFVYGVKTSWNAVILSFKAAPVFTAVYYAIYMALLGYCVHLGMANSWWLAAGLYIVGGTVLNLVSFIRMRTLICRNVNFN